jgi:hypothetical protein
VGVVELGKGKPPLGITVGSIVVARGEPDGACTGEVIEVV